MSGTVSCSGDGATNAVRALRKLFAECRARGWSENAEETRQKMKKEIVIEADSVSIGGEKMEEGSTIRVVSHELDVPIRQLAFFALNFHGAALHGDYILNGIMSNEPYIEDIQVCTLLLDFLWNDSDLMEDGPSSRKASSKSGRVRSIGDHSDESGVLDASSMPRKKRARLTGQSTSSSVIPLWQRLPDPTDCSGISHSNDGRWDDSHSTLVSTRESETRSTVIVHRQPNSEPALEEKRVRDWYLRLKRRCEELQKTRMIPLSIARESGAEKALMTRKLRPLIVVPSAQSARLTLANCRALLESGRYEMKTGASASAATTVMVRRDSELQPGTVAEFEVRSEVTKKQDWRRVCAVFVLGKQWQFGRWPKPWNSPEWLFTHCAGFFIHLRGDSVPSLVGKWNVRVFELSRDSRHADSGVSLTIWNLVLAALRKHPNKHLFF